MKKAIGHWSSTVRNIIAAVLLHSSLTPNRFGHAVGPGLVAAHHLTARQSRVDWHNAVLERHTPIVHTVEIKTFLWKQSKVHAFLQSYLNWSFTYKHKHTLQVWHELITGQCFSFHLHLSNILKTLFLLCTCQRF